MRQFKLLSKAGMIGLLVVTLLIPLLMIQGAVSERQGFRDGVIQDIARSAAESQQIIGPILVVPYREKIEITSKDNNTGRATTEIRYEDRTVSFLPDRLEIGNSITTEERYRGIHKALLYTTNMSVKGAFALPDGLGLGEAHKRGLIEWKPAYLVIGVHDIRGIKTHPRLTWQNQQKPFEPGTNDSVTKNGVHANIGIISPQAQTFDFAFDLLLQGMERLEILPIGKDTTVTMQSSWPHPSFIGRHLPERRRVTEQGFDAAWHTSYFSTNMEQLFAACAHRECPSLHAHTLGVSFIQPVDVYQQAERAVKYGILFIGLTFIAFFLFELFKRLAIHPVQYGFVGAALCIFYLLLLSLSEHLSFGLSYLIAGGACVTLLGVYTTYILKSIVRSAGFTGMMGALYGVLYILLRQEDYALLMGSLLLFTILAFVMLITRNIDWYDIGAPLEPINTR
ncbi:MAG: cell envelope integrity protein CreD [Nitrospira sp.]|nr:cell envelope integrity protein CreD [Nitrospira sp.]